MGCTYPLQAAREKARERRKDLLYTSDKKCVSVASDDSMVDLEEKISEYAVKRQERIETFVQGIRTKHRLYLEQACPHPST